MKGRERGRNAELQSFVTVFEKVDRKEIPDGWVRFGVASDNAVEEQARDVFELPAAEQKARIGVDVGNACLMQHISRITSNGK